MIDQLFNKVFVIKPSDDLHEYKYPESLLSIRTKYKGIYDTVRQLLISAQLDKGNFNTERWNPLGEFIKPGNNVLVKPNLVLHESHNRREDYYSVVTHPVLIRCITDYVAIALNKSGKITIGDAPINSANFDLLCENLNLVDLKTQYEEIGQKIDLVDFRLYKMMKDSHGIITNQESIANNDDYVEIILDKESSLIDISDRYERFRVTEYDGDTMPVYHNKDTHRYCFHKSALEADVVIGIPKIKTHRKAGMTCAMKNFVGLNGNKDWLPHHTKYSIEEGGDEYLNKSFRKKVISKSWDIRWKLKNIMLQKLFLWFERQIIKSRKIIPFKDDFSEGSWYGNRTISRTVNDLNRAILYCGFDGKLKKEVQRKILYLVDGIICGEGEGPMAATSKYCNMLLWGYNAYAIDLVVSRLIGFDYNKMDTFNVCGALNNYKIADFKPEEIDINLNGVNKNLKLNDLREYAGFNFKPSSGWLNHIEL
jgi:uncharacterized protein (DUF362 family)